VRSIEDFLTYFRRQRSWTRSLVEAIPEEHFDWRPSPETFSCGETVRHLILSENFWRKLLMEGAVGRPFDPFGLPGAGIERMRAFRPRNLASSAASAARYGATFAECLGHWAEIQARTEQDFAGITPEQLRVEIVHPLMNLRLPLWELLLTMVTHEAHHRGQLSAYLKVLGVEQPPMLGDPGSSPEAQ